MLRLSPSRGIALPGIVRADLPALAADVHAAGLIVDPDDPRLAVAACPGRPACGRATTDTHADAARLAAAARALIASGAAIHVSGCPKGCAHAGAADLTLVGEAGAYRVVVRGSARDPGGAPQRLEAILAQLHAGSPP